MKSLFFLTSIVSTYVILFFQLNSVVQASDDHVSQHSGHKNDQIHDDHHEKDQHEKISTIQHAMAKQVGLVFARTGPKTLHQTLTTYGRLTTAPEHTSHVRARFSGIVRSVAVTTGDNVTTGDVLAVIESNDSLKSYEVRAPISGTIIQRHANAGEMTQDQILFSISNFSTLWAELRIFSTQQSSIRAGQSVILSAGDRSLEANIEHVIPAENLTPYFIARAKIEKVPSDWFPGLMIEGAVITSQFNAPLAIKRSALHILDGRNGIFVKKDNTYYFTELVLGRSDSEFTEVISGINANVEYVTTNSYLLKADIEKSEAEHVH